MDNEIATFLAFTATEDAAVAKQYLEISGNNVEYAVQLFLESGSAPQPANDEEVAQRLQQEAYEDNGVREADANVHRHETLLDSFPSYQPQVDTDTAMFGTGRVGVFNQRFGPYGDDALDDDYEDEPRIVDLDDLDDDDVMELDDDGEPVRPTRRVRLQTSRMSELTSTQRRLARLFKPPFDLIERTDLDGAKIKGRLEQKWILVNIQDQSEFQCQVLNRDFWSNTDVKRVVLQDFVFLQYQRDSPNGTSYLNFYSIDAYPHISILDPMTGERVKTWTDGTVPPVDEWITDVELFLEKFSLRPGSTNPLVQHEVRFDPDAMTEEQQIEYALKQSRGGADEPIAVDDDEPEPPATQDAFESIQPVDHDEPTSGSVTRIQVRFPNGKRLVHKFDFESSQVLQIYQWLKYVIANADASVYGVAPGERFSISCVGKPKLLDILDQSIGDAGLKNASILLEKE